VPAGKPALPELGALEWEHKALDCFLTKAARELLSESSETLKFSPTQTVCINQLLPIKKCFPCPEKPTSFC